MWFFTRKTFSFPNPTELTWSPRSPLTWLVMTWMETAEVKAEITGAEMKLMRKPEK